MQSVSTRKLLRLLARIGEEICEIAPAVNYGGCAVVAHLVGAHLERLGVPCEVTTSSGSTAAEARAGVLDPSDPYAWDDNGLGRGHLAARFKIGRTVYTWDAEELSRDEYTFGAGGAYEAPGPWGTGLTIAECRAMASRQAGWNRAFNRRLIPAIRRIINQHFSAADLTSAPRPRKLRPVPQLTLGF